MTVYQMKMTIIQYRSCLDNLTATGRLSPWPCVGVDLRHDAPSPGLYPDSLWAFVFDALYVSNDVLLQMMLLYV